MGRRVVDAELQAVVVTRDNDALIPAPVHLHWGLFCCGLLFTTSRLRQVIGPIVDVNCAPEHDQPRCNAWLRSHMPIAVSNSLIQPEKPASSIQFHTIRTTASEFPARFNSASSLAAC
jgi:hypothetical protein